MARGASLHVEILLSLRESLTDRRETLLEKVGGGLDDKEYQRHVGRIAELKTTIEQIDVFLKNDVDEVEDRREEKQREIQHDRAARRRPNNR